MIEPITFSVNDIIDFFAGINQAKNPVQLFYNSLTNQEDINQFIEFTRQVYAKLLHLVLSDPPPQEEVELLRSELDALNKRLQQLEKHKQVKI